MTRRADAPAGAAPPRRGAGADVSRQFEQLSEIVGRGAPLDSMARARALGIVALLERTLDGDERARRTFDRLHELVGGHAAGHDGSQAEVERGARLVAALDELRDLMYGARPPVRSPPAVRPPAGKAAS